MSFLLKSFIIIFFIFNSYYSFSDHQLKKNNKEAIAIHQYRLFDLKKSFKNEEISKSSKPIEFIDISKPNKMIKKIMSKSDLLSVLYFNGNEIEINEISKNKIKEDTLIYSMSMAKSYIGYLIGHAICDNYIGSIDDKIQFYLRETKGTVYENATIREITNMSAGDKNFFKEGGYKNKTSKSYAAPILNDKIPILDLLKKTNKKYKSKNEFYYSNILTDIAANALDRSLPMGIGNYFKIKIIDRAGFKNNVIFLRDNNNWTIFFAFMYSSRKDYLKFGKLLYDDYTSNSCISNYLKKIIDESISTKMKKTKDFRKYSAFFWMGNKSLKFKHLALRGHGGQIMIVNLEFGSVLLINSIRKNYDYYKLEKKILKKLVRYKNF